MEEEVREVRGVSASPTAPLVNGACEQSPPSGRVSTDAELAEILRRAADLIEPEGAWTQGAFSRNADGSTDKDGEDDPDGVAERPVCWCVLGAIATAAGHDLMRWSYPGSGPVMDAQRALQAVVNCDPPTWNDKPERTQEEVVAALRDAASEIEARTTGAA